MYEAELDSFVLKFRQLWRAGCDAHLDVNTHAGQAWLGLHVRLGHADGPLYQENMKNVNKSRNGPSRQRRRQRRAAIRKQAEEASSSKETTETVVDNVVENNDVIEEVTTATIERPIEEENDSEEEEKLHKVENAEKADEKIGETNCDEENEKRKVEDEVEDEQNIHEEVVQEHTAANIEKELLDKNNDAVAEYSRENIVPSVVKIYATAVIDNSPNATLSNEDVGSLAKILGNKDHLVNNIANFEYSYLSSKELRTKFKHTVGLVIIVKTCNLWEGARSYIWKHLGRDTWTLRNGSEVNIVKIHQK